MSEEDDQSGWQLTESDPGVFSELLRTLGVPLIVDDLYSFDNESLAAFQPLRAFVFLFKWIPGASEPESTGGAYDAEFPGFFAHQTVNNACATLAILNAIGNIPDISQGQQLRDLLSFCVGMDPQTRGMAITSADWLREAHNSLSPPATISLDGLGAQKSSEDAYHFVAYLPYLGTVYELDGLKQYPVRHGTYKEQGGGWIETAREVIENRIRTYPAGALEFSLLAVHDDPLPALKTKLDAAQASGDDILSVEIAQRLAEENSKRERWAFENALRRHNHLGLLHGLLVALAKGGKLGPATEGARKAMAERMRKAKGEASMDED